MFKQGDIVSVNFPFSDITFFKKRPALIVSNQKVNQSGDYLLVQITSKVKNDGLSLQLKRRNYLEKELPLQSYIRIHKIFLLNESLILQKVSAVKHDFVLSLSEKIFELIR